MWFQKANKSKEERAAVIGAAMQTQQNEQPEDTASATAVQGNNVKEEKKQVDGTGLGRDGSRGAKQAEHPSGITLLLLLSSVFASMFIVALDRLIIATAVPHITDEFHSVDDIGWYGSAYLLSNCALQLLFGKFFTLFSIKTVFLLAVLLFEVGSAVCGAAPSSVVLIIGRALAGMGSAGITSGTIVIIVYAVPLEKRPLYSGMFGAIFGIASVVGPLLGGVFTSKLTWRWCFYINLPFGGIAMAVIALLLKIPNREATRLPLRQKLVQLDAIGSTLFIPGSVCLLLALQWGGSTYTWGNGRIVALLVLAGVLLPAFVAVQFWRPATATVPPRIFLQRSIYCGALCTLCTGAHQMLFVYFLPVWFQAIQGVTAVQSGIRTLPLVLSMVASVLTTGILTTRVGYYKPFIISGVCVASVGAGLLTTLQVDTVQARWVGYQFIYGWGLGLAFQGPNLAAQTVLPRHDVPMGTSLMLFSQLLGGAIFISVGQNVLDSQLISRLSHVSGLDAQTILGSGATSLTELPEAIKHTVLLAYNESLRHVFRVGLLLVCLTIFGALGLEMRTVKQNIKKTGKKSDSDPEKVDDTTAATGNKESP